MIYSLFSLDWSSDLVWSRDTGLAPAYRLNPAASPWWPLCLKRLGQCILSACTCVKYCDAWICLVPSSGLTQTWSTLQMISLSILAWPRLRANLDVVQGVWSRGRGRAVLVMRNGDICGPHDDFFPTWSATKVNEKEGEWLGVITSFWFVHAIIRIASKIFLHQST